MRLIFKLLYRFYRAGSLLWHWSQRRFTQAGLCVAGALVVTGSVGLDIENTVTYQAFSLLLVIVGMAVAASWFFRAHFSVMRLLPRLATAGQPFHYRVMVKTA